MRHRLQTEVRANANGVWVRGRSQTCRSFVDDDSCALDVWTDLVADNFVVPASVERVGHRFFAVRAPVAEVVLWAPDLHPEAPLGVRHSGVRDAAVAHLAADRAVLDVDALLLHGLHPKRVHGDCGGLGDRHPGVTRAECELGYLDVLAVLDG